MTSSRAFETAIACGRFGLGARPGELDQASADPRAWLKAQIQPRGADQPSGALPTAKDRLAAYRAALADFRQLKEAQTGAMTQDAARATPLAANLKAERRARLGPIREGVDMEILARAQLAATTSASFRERWALFWTNHFTVSTAKPKAAMLAGPFEREAIRPHVFGSFETLLVASSSHPGMLLYLDQVRSSGPNSLVGARRGAGLNENLAREIMELHTVGPDAGYTQADVTEFARALTGYSIGLDRDGPEVADAFLFRANLHEPGERTLMGRRYAAGGVEQARAVLSDLAASPHTADHLSRQLAAHFVADEPPPQLVARLKRTWLESRGDLAEVAGALVAAPEAWTPDLRKYKRPYEFLISSYRAVGGAPTKPPDVIQPLTRLGERPLNAPQPNGWSDQASDWAAPDGLVKRLDWAAGFSAAQAGSPAPLEIADAALGARLTPGVRQAVARAETRPEALTLLLMSPEFQRR